MFHVISAFSEGRVIPTELQKDALDLRKAMKYDDDEREGLGNNSKLYVVCK